MTARIEPLLTIADWDAIPYDEWHRYEIIEGELFVSCSPGLTHQTVATNLTVLIGIFLATNPIGTVVATPGLILSKFSGVIPDIVVFLNEQRETIVSNDRLTGPPALVVEILSPGSANTRRDRVVKLNLYAKHGVPEYWIVDPKNRSLERYVLQESSLELLEILTTEDYLTINALPGFSCPMSRVFNPI
ncbi:MAG TPA: Uma2 family endonuclease [Pyrinomonadaceae bacterium]|nr:Uma2 family endonuclease [Pyrinomonadaceae bacterium]